MSDISTMWLFFPPVKITRYFVENYFKTAWMLSSMYLSCFSYVNMSGDSLVIGLFLVISLDHLHLFWCLNYPTFSHGDP